MATPQNPFQPDNLNSDAFNNNPQNLQGFDPNANPAQDFTQPQPTAGDYDQPQPFDTYQGVDPNPTVDFNQDYGADPNLQTQDFAGQEFNQGYSQDPNQVDDAYPQATADYPVQDTAGYDQYDQVNDPSIPPQSIAANTTFEEKKGGNRTFYFIIGGVIIILAIVAATLFAMNFAGNDDDSDDDDSTQTTQEETNNNSNPTPTPVTSPEPEPVSDVISGGADTPATLSRRNAETTAPVTWFQQYFTAPFIDSQGACLTVSFCDIQADPDNDGLSNIQEYNFGTDPQRNDTDQDGLADGDEILRYYTSARSKDSDNDGFEDIDELGNCYDPVLNSESKMNETRLTQLSANISISPLREPTRSELIKAGASNTDVQLRGYNSSACDTAADTSTTDQPVL